MSRTAAIDPIEAALEIFAETKMLVEEISKRILEERTEKIGEKIREEDRKRIENELGSKLRARSREIPELIEEIGLVPALSFLYSKKDDKDYFLMLRAILLYLQRIKVVTPSRDIDSSIESGELIRWLQALREKSVVITPILRLFLVEFKRLCEATWKARESV